MISLRISEDLQQKLHGLNNKFAATFAMAEALSEDEKSAIHRFARISMIGASTRIENAQLTDSEINWIDTILTEDSHVTAFEAHRQRIEDKLSKDRERSIEEVAGCRLMLHTIYEQSKDFFPLTEVALRGLHAELMRYYRRAGPNVGRYKTQPNYVVEQNHQTKETRIVFKTADAGPITSAAMSDLLSFYNASLPNDTWTVAVATEFVFRFLAIHPFQDGNGRVGRGLFLMSLLQSPHKIISSVAPYLAIDRQIEKHKAEYYSVLNKCSNGVFQIDPRKYHVEYFLSFMIKMLEKSLADVEHYRLRHQKVNELSESGVRVLDCFKEFPEVRLTTKDIVNETHIPRRTVVNALNTLLDANLIQRYGKGSGVRYQLLF